MYQIIRSILFLFSPENAHNLVLRFLKRLHQWGLVGMIFGDNKPLNSAKLERKIAGLNFKNPVGLAAGLDKNGEVVEAMASLGFGFIEVGTVTPLPQPGNEQPRMFRLTEDEALINRMGFNNLGVDVVVSRLRKLTDRDYLIGGNIGKNKNTPNEDAIKDYVICFEKMFDVVDYFVVNVSSPNTPNLRELQDKAPLTALLNTLQCLNLEKDTPKPVFLKIAPDLTNEQLNDIISIVTETKIAGVIATNTTISREKLKSENSLKAQQGGLSGKPLRERSTEVIKYLATHSKGIFPIIGVGGIHHEDDAIEKLEAGACLVQLYTGFVYEGPALIRRINEKIVLEA